MGPSSPIEEKVTNRVAIIAVPSEMRLQMTALVVDLATSPNVTVVNSTPLHRDIVWA